MKEIKCKSCGSVMSGVTVVADFQQVSERNGKAFFEEIEIHECHHCGCHHRWTVTSIALEELDL